VWNIQTTALQNLYKSAAREVMDKYNITAELPAIKQALFANKLASDVSAAAFQTWGVVFGRHGNKYDWELDW